MSTLRGSLSRRRGVMSALIAGAAALVLVGCSTASSIATETVRGLPTGVTLTDSEQQGEQPVAIWTDNRETLTVVTWGSSSCPAVPISLAVESAPLMQLRFAAPTDQACTADFAPTSHVLATPEGFSFGAVQLEVTFEARAADEPRVVTVPIRDQE